MEQHLKIALKGWSVIRQWLNNELVMMGEAIDRDPVVAHPLFSPLFAVLIVDKAMVAMNYKRAAWWLVGTMQSTASARTTV
jgi:hypothetical protein